MLKIDLIGNVGNSPVSRADQSGNSFVTFSVGITGGKDKKTTWAEISCNNKLAEVVSKYVTKGMKIYVSGFPSINTYTNKDGKVVGSLRVYANNIEFLSSNKLDDNGDVNGNVVANGSLTSDEIPF